MADRLKNISNMAQNYSNKIMGSNCYLIVVYLLSIVFIIIFTRNSKNKFSSDLLNKS